MAIDFSKAQRGDKFIDREGKEHTFLLYVPEASEDYKAVLMSPAKKVYSYTKDGRNFESGKPLFTNQVIALPPGMKISFDSRGYASVVTPFGVDDAERKPFADRMFVVKGWEEVV